MSGSFFGPPPEELLGTPELQLPAKLQEPVRQHLEELRRRYLADNWANPVGFGQRPAVVVVDLALRWTKPGSQMGTRLDPVVDATCRILDSARAVEIPIFFSTSEFDPEQLPRLHSAKVKSDLGPDDGRLLELDPRLGRRPSEKLFTKRSSSCFAGTALLSMLNALDVDTLIVTGVSTSHCVYATCRDACDHFRVIIPREAVGERCQIMHMAFLLDLDLNAGDVLPTDDVIAHMVARRS